MKKLIILLLSLSLIMSMAGCSKVKDALGLPGDYEVDKKDYYKDGVYTFADEKAVSMGKVENPLNPKDVYEKVKYIPEMFYGDYEMLDFEANKESYISNVGFNDDYLSQYNAHYTTIPYAMKAGEGSLNHIVTKIEGYDWAQLYFQTDTGYMDYIYAGYKVSGNKITFTKIDSWEYDKESLKLSYTMSELVLEYEFEFSGPNLTLSANGKSVTMQAKDFTSKYGISIDNYLSSGSEAIGMIDSIDLDAPFTDSSTSCVIAEKDNYTDNYARATMSDDGLFTITYTGSDEKLHTYQYVYFYAGYRDGIVLTDGVNTYCYNDTWSERNYGDFYDNLTLEDMDKLESLPDSKVEEIVEKKANLLTDLAAAYKDAGLNVDINEKTGEITLDSTILFGVDEYEVSTEGRDFLKKFIDVYTKVVFDEKYENFISYIMVEGHTDTNGDYDMNMELSQNRADSVKEYCLSEECEIMAEYQTSLTDMLKSIGYSYDKPVYNDNGEVDMDASRRVSFRFMINLEG